MARSEDGLPACDEECGPAVDLFDMPRPAPARSTAPAVSASPVRVAAPRKDSGVELARLVGRGGLLGAASAMLRFPLWMTVMFISAAVLGELAHAWRPVRRVYWTAVLSGLCTESTAVFITPFTWPLRFVFFFTLIGAVILFYGMQTNDLL